MKQSILPLACLMLAATPAAAQQDAPNDTTIKQIGNSVTEPFDGKDIPEKLAAIQTDPYSLVGMRKCAAIMQEVRELDDVLGPDVNVIVDKDQAKKREETAGRLVATVGKSLIPFRGLVSEITGANAERRRYAIAAYAGTARRGFLKGIGLERGCKAPARP